MELGPKRRWQDSLHHRWLGPEIDEQPSLDSAFDDWNAHAVTDNNLSNGSGYRAVRINDEGNDIRPYAFLRPERIWRNATWTRHCPGSRKHRLSIRGEGCKVALREYPS